MKTKYTILSLLFAAAASATAQTSNGGAPVPIPPVPPVPPAPPSAGYAVSRAVVGRTAVGGNVEVPTVKIDQVTAPVEWTYAEAPDGVDIAAFRANSGPVTFLGVSTSSPSQELSTQLAVPADTGLVVDFVTPGSPAEKAGVQTSDVLTKLDDQILILPRQLAVLVANHKEGESVKISLIRKGQPQEITAILGKQEGEISAIPADLAAKLGDIRILVDGKPQQALRTFTRRLTIPAEGADSAAPSSSNAPAGGAFGPRGRVPAEAIDALKRSLNQAGIQARDAREEVDRATEDANAAANEAAKSMREELKDMRRMLEDLTRKMEAQQK